MKLKQKLLLALVASILAAPTAFAAPNGAGENTTTADDNIDFHNVSINVPEIALIDVTPDTTGTIPAITFTAPEDAGAGFTTAAVANNTSKLAYSSNVAEGSTTSVRKITVDVASVAGQLSGVPVGVTLTPSVAGITGSQGASQTCDLTSTTVTCDLVTGIKNYATSTAGKDLSYGVAIDATTGGMIGHTGGSAKTLKLVYTLSSAS